jgi:hypothetical protein
MLRGRRLACLGCGLLALTGCSLVLDFESNRSPTPAVMEVRAYRFLLGAGAYAVSASDGLLGPGSSRSSARSMPTERGGSVVLAADGGFVYEPPGPSDSFWGDDAFELALREDAPGKLTRVRLTVHPRRLELRDVSAGAPTGFNVLGPSGGQVGGSSRGLAALGDVNGDGLDDWAAAAPGYANLLPPEENLSVYVVFGGVDSTLSLDTLDVDGNGAGFRIKGQRPADFFASAVAGAGDVNGDGLDDVVVGARGVDDARGAAYVIFGKADTAPVLVADIEQGSGGYAIFGDEATSFQGHSVAGAGDVDGDGLDDVVVGGVLENAGEFGVEGLAFVIAGQVGTDPVQLADIKAGHGKGFAVLGAERLSFLGFDVRGAGDVNGDGLDDVVIGAPSLRLDYAPDVAERPGNSYVIFGKIDRQPVPVAELAAPSPLGFQIAGADLFDRSGMTVSGAGDVNGDGFDDVVVSSPCADLGMLGAPRTYDQCAANFDADVAPTPDVVPPTGLSYVVFGQREPVPVRLSDIEPGGSAAGFLIVGSRPDDQLGASLSAGDLDGDGLSDLLIGTANRSLQGRAYIVFGKTDTTQVVLAEIEAAATVAEAGVARAQGGLAILGAQRDAAGVASTTGLDLNGDGLDDLLVGALLHPMTSPLGGGAYASFGWDMSGALANRHDVVLGGAFDDLLPLPELPVVKVRGGNGRDTLVVTGHGRHIDLASERAHFESIEVIDLRGDGPNTLRLDDAAVRRIPQNHAGFAFGLAHTLSVLGDPDDQLQMDLRGYDVVNGREGRAVYARVDGSYYYGLEVSQALPIAMPVPSP